MKKIVLVASMTLFASACATQQSAEAPAPTPAVMTVTGAIAAAEAARKQAAGVGAEWRDTGKIIAQAKKAEAAKDTDKAIELAEVALRQSKNAIRQYDEQKDASSRF